MRQSTGAPGQALIARERRIRRVTVFEHYKEN